MGYKLNNPKYHIRLTDCDGTHYVLVTTQDNPVVNLFVTDKDDINELQLLEAVLFIDHNNGDPKNPGPMIEWCEGVMIRPEVVKWFIDESVRILKTLWN
jgi:hypothetical protein